MQHTDTTLKAWHLRCGHDRHCWCNCHQHQPETTRTIQQFNPSLPATANADPCFSAKAADVTTSPFLQCNWSLSQGISHPTRKVTMWWWIKWPSHDTGSCRGPAIYNGVLEKYILNALAAQMLSCSNLLYAALGT